VGLAGDLGDELERPKILGALSGHNGGVDRWAEACEALAAANPCMAKAIAAYGPCTLVKGRAAGGAFGALARSICYQQLAGRAAAAIHGRFAALYAGRPTPAAVAATPDDVLRAAGLSANKAASIKDLAAKALDGTVRLEGWGRQSDEEVIERLTQVRGIGPWTAQMFLMFQLNRPDIWPAADFGVGVGFARIHDLATAPTARELAALGDPYRPFRTIAAWYCWRAVDTPAFT
jgi:3-methyladenine DNA glycosylase/8-oxoguanine DNA glycosylase